MNQSSHDEWKLLTRYVAGECTEREKAEVEARICVDDDKARLLREAQWVWKATEPPAGGVDADAAWTQLRRRAQHPPQVALRSSVDSELRRGAEDRDRRGHRQWMRMSAVLAVVLLLSALAYQLLPRPAAMAPAPAPEEAVFATSRGERAIVRLNDGTRVRLNVDSRLIVPLTFAADRRAVRIEGEAFFEVTHDPLRPFVVSGGGALVEVRGTAFSISAYPEDDQVDVAVDHGSVALASADPSRPETILVEGSEVGRLTGAGVQVVHRGAELDRYLGWTRDQLVFQRAPFDQVARRLERWFDIEVELDAPPDAVTTLDVTFDDESLHEVLTVIAATLGLEFESKQRQVIFHRKAPAPA